MTLVRILYRFLRGGLSVSGNPVTQEIDNSQSGHQPPKAGRFPIWVDKTFEIVLAGILFVELFILFGNIVLREVFHYSFVWAEEAASLSLVAITFIGGAIAYYEGAHLSVRVLVDKLPEHWRSLVEASTTWMVMVLTGLCGVLIVPTIGANWGYFYTGAGNFQSVVICAFPSRDGPYDDLYF